jgi:hypothetical protein
MVMTQLVPRHQLNVFAAATLVLTTGIFAFFGSADARAQSSAGACTDSGEAAVLSSPITPWKGAPLRVLFVAEKPLESELALIAPDGSVAASSRQRNGGPPYFWYAEVKSPAAGMWHARLARDHAPAGCSAITRDITVRADRPLPPKATAGSIWPMRNSWNRAMENFYSAWIEKLFDAPLDVELSWPALHVGLRDRSRNFLFNYLGLGEDELKLIYRPDCADLPYFLRAYFAFKMGLPFGYSKCSRGSHGKPPYCVGWTSIQHTASASTPEPATTSNGSIVKRLGLVSTFGSYLRTVADGVHSGTARTPLNDNNTDLYPVRLSQDTLRPGTVYADPYGHTLVLVRRVPQSQGRAGVFLAVDAQPDGTVARKRFWRGNFLFVQDPRLGGPGFKRFRPIVLGKNGVLRRLTNDEIAKDSQYSDFSLEQSELSVEGFYDRMDDVMSPEPLEPLRAMKEAIISLAEQVEVRVTSVENGRKYQNGAHGEVSMPDGPKIFETTGPWEDFSTPARDLRLLIAMDVVRSFPDRVARRPNRYAMPQDKSVADVKAELQNVLGAELAARKFSYPRSDGSSWTLTLKDLFDRAAALEMAYNPNDCVELRWGAPAKSAEASTCKRYAPAAQRAKMTKYRPWFNERRRPPRA